MAKDLDFNAIKSLLDQAEDCVIKAKQKLFDSYLLEKSENILVSNSDKDIIEGVFDGENMIGPDQKKYSVPANYASKSKLLPGDLLKLTIGSGGNYMFKQIAPVDRKIVVGTLTETLGKYYILANDLRYRVLKASVTYFKVNPGDKLLVSIPENNISEWAAIENIAE